MHRYWKSALIVVLFAALAVAQQKPAAHHSKAAPSAATNPEAAPNLPPEETIKAFLQQMFGYNTALSWKVEDVRPSEAEGLSEVTVVISGPQGQQSLKFYVTEDGKHAITGTLMPFGADPFAAARKELGKEARGPSRGPADAPVTVVEFSDLQCPHCKATAPILDKLLSEEKNVRMIFENFPLPMHDWAAKAAAYADCVGHTSNDAFWKFIQSTYEAQAEITAANADEKLGGLADAAGAKSADVAACAAKPETTAHVEQSMALGRALKITGTPTLFINGRAVENAGGIPYSVLKQLVDFAALEAGEQQSSAK